jgi:hypothetical protein
MKGTLMKTEQGWVVEYAKHAELPLHPEFIEMMDTCFTSKFTHEIEFEIVRYCKKHNSDPSKNSVCTLDCGYEEVSYAKLIHHPVDTNEMISKGGELATFKDHVPDAGKMVEDDYIEELTKGEIGWYDKHDDDQVKAFIAGYNKAKETLYTEEDIAKAVMFGRWGDTDKLAYMKFIKSLKQGGDK